MCWSEHALSFFKLYFPVCLSKGCFLFMCVGVLHACLFTLWCIVPIKTTRSCWFCWNWRYRWLLTAMWVLGTELGSLKEQSVFWWQNIFLVVPSYSLLCSTGDETQGLHVPKTCCVAKPGSQPHEFSKKWHTRINVSGRTVKYATLALTC